MTLASAAPIRQRNSARSRVNDPSRLAAVKRSGLLGFAREAQYDELTRAAALTVDTPYASMTGIDDRQSFWKSTFGISDGRRSGREARIAC